MKFKIEAFLKADEGGCYFSKYFENNFIKNEKLHPLVKDIELKYDYYKNIPEPEVRVLNDKGVVVFQQKGNQVNPSKLQEFLIGELEVIDNKETK